jgi:diphthamide synthase (EF-2-diphthine--ammonia ligase)
MKRVLMSWSSGKDSAWALNLLRCDPSIEIVGLLTTLNAEFQRVAMHGTRRSVLEGQAEATQLPLWVVPLPWLCSNETYEQRMTDVCTRAISEQVDAIAFGDLFLRDVRAYRERQLAPTGLEPLFPLWDIFSSLGYPDRAACPRHDCGRSSRPPGLRGYEAIASHVCRPRIR